MISSGMVLRGCCTFAVAVMAALPSFGFEHLIEPSVHRRIIVVSPTDNDPRLVSLREGISFWNRVLGELEVDLRLVESDLLIASEHEQALENYTRKIWQQAGRQRAGDFRLSEPEVLRVVGGETVVFFSAQPTMAFAWPLRQSPNYFIAIPRESKSASAQGGTTRNVIAHELGHMLGLVHRDDPLVLMCSPCRTEEAITDDYGFLELTDGDRQRLRELH